MEKRKSPSRRERRILLDSRGVEDETLPRRSHSDTITSPSTSGVCDAVATGSKQSRIISIDNNVDKTTHQSQQDRLRQ